MKSCESLIVCCPREALISLPGPSGACGRPIFAPSFHDVLAYFNGAPGLRKYCHGLGKEEVPPNQTSATSARWEGSACPCRKSTLPTLLSPNPTIHCPPRHPSLPSLGAGGKPDRGGNRGEEPENIHSLGVPNHSSSYMSTML